MKKQQVLEKRLTFHAFISEKYQMTILSSFILKYMGFTISGRKKLRFVVVLLFQRIGAYVETIGHILDYIRYFACCCSPGGCLCRTGTKLQWDSRCISPLEEETVSLTPQTLKTLNLDVKPDNLIVKFRGSSG